jgi:hypothetical protein
MSAFEGFDNKTTCPAHDDVFTSNLGPDPTPAPGNGSLPPGATETPGFTKRTPSTTKAPFLKSIGD